MDTQIKIEIQTRDYDNSEKILSSRNLDFDYALKQNEIVFNFKETDNCFIKFEYEESDLEIKYENFDGEMELISSGSYFMLSSGREEFGCYFCGLFTIEITCKKNTKSFFFKVEPKHLSFENIVHLRDYVNQFYNGLSLNLLKTRNATQELDLKTNNPSIYDNYRFLLKEFPKLMNYINQYLNHRLEEPIKKSVISHNSKKISAETIKWMAKKGMDKNANINSPETLLVRRTTFDINVPSNQYFKQQLMFWNNELKEILKGLNRFSKEIDESIKMDILEIKKCEEKIYSLENQWNVSARVKKTEKDKLDRFNDCIKEKKQLLDFYQNDIEILRHFKTSIEFYLYNSWIKQVSDTVRIMPKKIDTRLRMLDKFQKDYLEIKKGNIRSAGKSDEVVFAERCTPKLFETYCFILLINLLHEFGFDFDNSFDYKKENMLFLLTNPNTLTLYNDDLCCDIIYDNELKKSNSKFTESSYCYINSTHNRPDFILSFYKDQNKPLASIIIEVKWRALSSIYNPVEDTKVVDNLKDYFNLAFHDNEKRKNNRGVITKVIVVYPDDEERITDIQEDEIIAAGIFPSDAIIDSKGYIQLKKEIQKVLDEKEIVLV